MWPMHIGFGLALITMKGNGGNIIDRDLLDFVVLNENIDGSGILKQKANYGLSRLESL